MQSTKCKVQHYESTHLINSGMNLGCKYIERNDVMPQRFDWSNSHDERGLHPSG